MPFELVNTKEISVATQSCLSKYPTHALNDEEKLIYNRILLEQVSALLKINFSDAQLFSAPGLNFKLAGQLTHTAGVISSEKRILEGPVEITINGEKKVFNGISTEGLVNLEYWDQRIFLLVHVMFLLDLYVQLLSPLLGRFNPDERVLLKEAIENELIIAVNAFRIRNYCHEMIQHTEKEKLLEEFVTHFLEQVSQYFQSAPNGQEFVFPVGYRTHAIYLTLAKFQGNHILFRVDNLMENDRHAPQEGKQPPFYLAYIPLNELTNHRLINDYLKNVSTVIEKEANEAEAAIYSRKREFNCPYSLQAGLGYPPLALQTIANCAYTSYSVGLQYRLWQLGGAEATKAFHWLITQELQFGFGDHSLPSYKSRWEELQAEKRERERELIRQGKFPDTKIIIDKLFLNDFPDQELFIPVNGSRSFSYDNDKPLEDEVNAFLGSDKKVLLLLGNAGSGKTMFLQRLAIERSKILDYQSPIPIYISLPSLKDPIHHLIQETFKDKYKFTDEQIESLKASRKFIFILDSYDEMSRYGNLYNTNLLKEWNAHVIIACRTQWLKRDSGNYNNIFVPSENGHPLYKKYDEIHIVPFSPDKINSYIKQYLEVKQKELTDEWKEFKTYEQYIHSIPRLLELITNPFILKITMETMPAIVAKFGNRELSERLILTEVDLYDGYIQNWFQRQEMKLSENNEEFPDVDSIRAFKSFAKKLAVAMHVAGKTEITYSSTENNEENEKWGKFLGSEVSKEDTIGRKGCPLRKPEANRFAFLHTSIQEYFVSRDAFEKTIRQWRMLEQARKASAKPQTSEVKTYSLHRFFKAPSTTPSSRVADSATSSPLATPSSTVPDSKPLPEAAEARKNYFNKLNATGNDMNLGQHGADDPYYWYSLSDGFRLLLAIRKNKLKYLSSDESPYAIHGNEEYSCYRENRERIFMADPYYVDSFNDSFVDDIKTIVGQHTQRNQKWQLQPALLIIPLLTGNHWRLIRVEVDYNNKNVSVLWDDPYGKNSFNQPLKERLLLDLKRGIELLIQVQLQDKEFKLTNEALTHCDKNIDQQGANQNFWDCAVITFSNIEDYTNQSRNQDFSEVNSEKYYTIPLASATDHAIKIAEKRKHHIQLYRQMEGINLPEPSLQRLIVARKFLTDDRYNFTRQFEQDYSLLIQEVFTWEPYWVDRFFNYLDNTRAALQEAITEEDIQIILNLIQVEQTKASKAISSSSQEKQNTSLKDKGEEADAIQFSIMQNRLTDLDEAVKKRTLTRDEIKERDELRQRIQTAGDKQVSSPKP